MFDKIERGEPFDEFIVEVHKYFSQIPEPLRGKMLRFDKRVQGYLEGMWFTWVPVTKNSDRVEGPKGIRFFEKKAIGLLSNFPREGIAQVDIPSPLWLGRYLTTENLRRSKSLLRSKMASVLKSGLWVHQYVQQPPSGDWLHEFELLVQRLETLPDLQMSDPLE
jgi:hypothetical protein